MKYDMPADIRQRLQAHLEAGIYQSEDHVLWDAMDALDQRELDRMTSWNDRNQLANEQSHGGLSKPLEDGQVLARLRERLAKE